MIHPQSVLRYINPRLGHGVCATGPIPLGTIVWVRDPLDLTLPLARLAAMPAVMREALDRYMFRDAHRDMVLCWDHARYMNHSCLPTCAGTRFGFEIAVRDIQPGEQLTDDYATLEMVPEESFECHCGVPGCRRWITPADTQAQSGQWYALMRGALQRLTAVDQPLWPLVDPEGLARALEAHDLAWPLREAG
jgi:hypothetical protein